MLNVSGRVVACVLFVIFSLEICEASNSSDEEGSTYDQRQHGFANIHVHVSDVGILHLLGGNQYSDEGYNDYSYEYEDPIEENGNVSMNFVTTEQTTTTTTITTVEPSNTSNSTDDSFSSTIEPSEVSKTNISFSDTNPTTGGDHPSSTTTPKPTTKQKSTTTSTIRTTEKPKITTAKPKPSITAKPTPSIVKPKPSATTFKPEQKNQTISSTEVVKEMTSALPVTESNTTQGLEETPSIYKSILAMLLPAAQAPQHGDNKKQGSRRRCGSGFYRDSRGRCRRVRKPNYQVLQRLPIELPFGIRIPPRPVLEFQEETA